MRAILRGMRALCEAGAAQGGEAAPGFEALLSSVDWEAVPATESDAIKSDAIKSDAAEPPPNPPTVERYLAAACEASSPPGSPAGDLAEALAASGHQLRWKDMYAEYDDEPDMAVFRRAYAYTLLVGPEAPFRSQRVKVGVTLQGPDVLYPPHAHKAKELYAVIGGTAEWKRGIEPWTARPPGDFVLHPSGVRHAMQTSAEPVLALVAWISDIHSTVVIVRG